MTLEEVRKKIDTIDPQLRELLMQRLDCSYEVAQVKCAAGETTIFRADREDAILKRLSEGIPEERVAGYLSVVKKIMETSRMYQYGLLYDWMDGVLDEILAGVEIPETCSAVCVKMTRPDRSGSMAQILSMIGDYGYDMVRLEQVGEDREACTATFLLEIRGDIHETHMKKLMFQLSKESQDFSIENCR